jgi:hypothetical protein
MGPEEQKTQVVSSDRRFKEHMYDKLEEIRSEQTETKVCLERVVTDQKWLRRWLGGTWAAIAGLGAAIWKVGTNG